MEKVISLELSGLSKPSTGEGKRGLGSGFVPGRIDEIIGRGQFVVLLENGQKIKAHGSPVLKIGNRVQVLSMVKDSDPKKGVPEPLSAPLEEPGYQWSAFLPLGFGGKGAVARLRVFVEKKIKGLWGKSTPAVYIVFTLHTEKQGELQWSVYLKGRQVSLQLFAEGKEGERGHLRPLAAGIEKNLKNRGFVLMAPTLFLTRPFRVPEGFHLNVKG